MGRVEDLLNKGKNIITNKHSRSIIVLFITIFIVFALNALLPVIEGSTHYTADAITMTYREYKDKSAINNNYNMTWVSLKKVEAYIQEYVEAHPELTIDERLLVEPPDGFKVDVYTKFFFQHPFWYMTTIVNLISALLIFYSVFNYLLTKRKTKYKRYLDLEEELSNLGSASLDPVTFEPWMRDRFNRPRKIEQHVSNIKRKLERLERKTPYKYKHINEGSPYTEQYKNYISRKEELNSYLQPDYIEEYVMDKDVKGFLYIYPTFVISGYNMSGHTSDSFSRIRSNAQRLGRDSFKKIIISMMLTTMFATLLTVTIISSTDKPWYWTILNIITSLAPLVIQVPMAFDYCENYMEEQLITNLVARRTIAYLYLADMKEDEEKRLLELQRIEEAKKLEDAQQRAQDEYFAKLNEELKDTIIGEEEIHSENISTEGPGDSSLACDGGVSEEYSE